MARDAQGHLLTGATAEAARAYDAAVRAFALAYGDAVGRLDEALRAAPDFAMGHLGKAWILALANDATMLPAARAQIASAGSLPLNERESAHFAALCHALEGHRASAVRVLDRHLMAAPLDVLGHYAALLLDAFQGRFPAVRDRSARALPRWSRHQPGYGIVLSFYGFGLEEAGDYARSEAVSRDAAQIEPHGYWPHHAVSHVMEMTGRPDAGLQWMSERAALWSAGENVNRVHIWWHKALFHVELGQYDDALQIYDGPIVESQRPLGISLTNASALLWRLEMLGCPAGDRWQGLADLWRNHADGRLCVFADLHAVMTALRADDGAEVARLMSAMQRTAGSGSEAAETYRDVGLPVSQGLGAFQAGDYAAAVEHLLPARSNLWKMGGSHAQRDLVDWTLTEAAIRADMRDIALSLAHERLALRPESHPNRRLLANAQALGV